MDTDESWRVRMNFWLTKKMYDYIEAMAIHDGRSMSDLLRQAIREFMTKYPLKEDGNGTDKS